MHYAYGLTSPALCFLGVIIVVFLEFLSFPIHLGYIERFGRPYDHSFVLEHYAIFMYKTSIDVSTYHGVPHYF